MYQIGQILRHNIQWRNTHWKRMSSSYFIPLPHVSPLVTLSLFSISVSLFLNACHSVHGVAERQTRWSAFHCSFSPASEGLKSKVNVFSGPYSSEGSRGECFLASFSFWWFLEFLGLCLSFHDLLFCVSPLIRTPVIGLRPTLSSFDHLLTSSTHAAAAVLSRVSLLRPHEL